MYHMAMWRTWWLVYLNGLSSAKFPTWALFIKPATCGRWSFPRWNGCGTSRWGSRIPIGILRSRGSQIGAGSARGAWHGQANLWCSTMALHHPSRYHGSLDRQHGGGFRLMGFSLGQSMFRTHIMGHSSPLWTRRKPLLCQGIYAKMSYID